MVAKPEDVYNSVPSVAPQVGSPENSLSVRATPASFGAQVGGALEQAGQKAEAGNQELFNTALQYQGMLNESAATDAATGAQVQRDNINAKYKTLEGFDAVGAREQTIADLAKVRQDTLAKISNPAVARAFNMLDHRQEAFSINEANTWGVTQGHQAATNSARSAVQLSVDQASNPDVAMSENRITDNIANIKFNVSRMMQLQGYGNYMSQDPKTGDVKFDSSPQGQSASAVYNQTLNTSVGKAYENIYDIKAFDPVHGNIVTAMDWAKSQYDAGKMPPETYSKLTKSSAVPYLNYQAKSGADTVFSQYEGKRLQDIEASTTGKYTPNQILQSITQQESSGGTNPAARNNINQIQPSTWSKFAKPGEDIANAKDNNSVALRIIQDSYNRSGGDAEKVFAEYFSGKQNPFSDATDKNGKSVQDYVADNMHRIGAFSGYQSQADFYRENWDNLGQDTMAYAQKVRPNDPVFADTMLSHVQTKAGQVIHAQDIQDRADTDTLIKYLTDPENPQANLQNIDNSTAPQDVKDAYKRQLAVNSQGLLNISNNLSKANAMGQAQGLGSDFYSHLSDVMSGKTSNIMDLGNYIGSDKNSPITNTGFKMLSQIAQDRRTPEGAAWANQELQFLNKMHDEATGSNIYPGIHSVKLEQQWDHNLMQLIPQINAAKASGKTSGDLFTEDSKDYIGKSVQLPTPAYIKSEHFSQVMGRIGIPDVKGQGGTEQLIKTLDDPTATADQKRQLLESAFKGNQLTATQADGLGRQYKLYNYAPRSVVGPSVPLPSDH